MAHIGHGSIARAAAWRRAAGLATVAVLALAGCGGGDDEGSPDTTSLFDDDPTTTTTTAAEETTTTVAEVPDACALVSKEEAEAVAGTALDEPVPGDAACTYTGPVTGPLAQFEVYVGEGAFKFLEIDRELQHVFEPIPGAGDESYLEDGTAFVRVGDLWVALRVVRLDELSVYRDAMTELAVAVAGRI